MTGRLIAGALAAAILFAGCSLSPPEPTRGEVVIGVDLPLTGPDAAASSSAFEAIAGVVRDEFRGRAEGLRVTLRELDDSNGRRRDPVHGRRNLDTLVGDRGVVGVIGPLNSDVALAEIPVAASAHLVMVSPAASSPCLTRDPPGCPGLADLLHPSGLVTFFRLVPGDDLESAALLSYATTSLHLSHIAVASDGQAYGNSERDAFLAAMKRAGLSPAAMATFDPASSADADAFLSASRAGGADAVFMGGRDEGGACRLAGRIRLKLDPQVPLLGGSGLRGDSCLKDAGEAVSAIYSPAAGSGTISDRSAVAARLLLRAVSGQVKASGGNPPSRESVRRAVARSADPTFDRFGDPAERLFTIYRGSPGGWTSLGPARA